MLSTILALLFRSAGRGARRMSWTRAAWPSLFLWIVVAPPAVSQGAAVPSVAPAARSAAAPAPSVAPGTAAAADGERPAIVVLGDSLSAGYGIRVEEGWVALLAERLRAQGYGYRVVNASVSGETTGGALARLPRVLKAHRPAIVLVELGGNDGLRGLPVQEMRGNLDRIVAACRATGAAVLVLGMRIPSNYGPKYTAEFADAFGAVARAHGAALVPFLLAGVADDERNFQPDRIHPVAAVQPRLLDTVWRTLAPLLARGAARRG
jgi:acyl-CoA thioesterase-1